MTVRGLIWLSPLLIMVAGTWGQAGEEDEPPRLKDRVVLNPQGAVSCDRLEFSRDGKTLFTLGQGDRKVRLWDVAGEKQIASLRMGVNRMTAFACSPDGKFLATVTFGGDLWIWDIQTRKKLRSFEVHEGISQLMYRPNGYTISAAAEGKLHVYDVEDGTLRHSINIEHHKTWDTIHPVASPRPIKRPLMVCGNQLFDAHWGTLEYRLTDGPFRGGYGFRVAITSDEKKMARGHLDIRMWDLTKENQDPARRKQLVLKHPRVIVRCLVFSPNNQILAAGYEDYHAPGESGFAPNRGGVLFFDASSGKLLYNQDARIAAVYALAFSPDGRLLATGDWDRVLKLWDVPAAWRKKSK